MADVTIRGVTYTGVAKLDLDKSGGGSALFYDTESADAVASDLLVGKTAFGASGLITGTKQPPSGSISITENGAVDVTDYATALVNVQSGGGGPTASDAILLVTVAAGSTVTATKGTTTLVPTLWTTAADSTKECALFIIEAAQFDSTTPWTIVATNGTNTKSASVLVDANNEYSIDLRFNLYLFDSGVVSPYVFTRKSGTVTINEGIYVKAGVGGTAYCIATPAVDFTNYSKLCMNVSEIDVNKDRRSRVYFSTTQSTSAVGYVGATGTGTFKVDISTYAALYYVGLFTNNNGGFTVDKVWLEPMVIGNNGQ